VEAAEVTRLRGWVRMGKITGFLDYERERPALRAGPKSAIKHWREFVRPLPEAETKKQAARCMDCGIPYCHTGCPVNNQIPDWNDLVYRSEWEEAARKPPFHQQFPGNSPAASVRRRARPPALSTSRTTR